LKIEGKRKILKKSVEGSFTLKGLGGYSFNGLKRKKKQKKGAIRALLLRDFMNSRSDPF